MNDALKLTDADIGSINDEQGMTLRQRSGRIDQLVPHRKTTALRSLGRWIVEQRLNKRDVCGVVGSARTAEIFATIEVKA